MNHSSIIPYVVVLILLAGCLQPVDEPNDPSLMQGGDCNLSFCLGPASEVEEKRWATAGFEVVSRDLVHHAVDMPVMGEGQWYLTSHGPAPTTLLMTEDLSKGTIVSGQSNSGAPVLVGDGILWAEIAIPQPPRTAPPISGYFATPQANITTYKPSSATWRELPNTTHGSGLRSDYLDPPWLVFSNREEGQRRSVWWILNLDTGVRSQLANSEQILDIAVMDGYLYYSELPDYTLIAQALDGSDRRELTWAGTVRGFLRSDGLVATETDLRPGNESRQWLITGVANEPTLLPTLGCEWIKNGPWLVSSCEGCQVRNLDTGLHRVIGLPRVDVDECSTDGQRLAILGHDPDVFKGPSGNDRGRRLLAMDLESLLE